jgi:hypothetical protein
MNIVRGVLAEFLVAKALDIDTSQPRNAWDNYDLIYDGTTIEVKSGARWQSYPTRRPSSIVFRGLKARRWDEVTGLRAEEPTVVADLYIFAAHDCTSPSDYDPLDTEQWRFFVFSGDTVRSSLGASVSIGSLRAKTTEVAFDALKAEVETRRAKPRSAGGPQEI